MTEPVCLAPGVLALAVLAFNSSSKLYDTIQSFQCQPRQVRELLNELSSLRSVLHNLCEQKDLTREVDLSALKFPLEVCRRSCNEVQTEMLTYCSRPGVDRATFRDWAKLKCNSGDGIEGFRTQLMGYKSIITVALSFMTLNTYLATPGAIQDFRDLIATTTVDLEAHLQYIQQKLETLAQHTAATTIPIAVIRQRMEGERLSTNKGLSLCATISHQTEELRHDQRLSTIQDPSSEPGMLVSSGPEVREDPILFTLEQLRKQQERATEGLAAASWEKGEVQKSNPALRDHSATAGHVLTSMANLASSCMDQGWWDEAEKLETQVLEMSKKRLGETHPSTLTSMANLASMYRDRGRWNKAEELEVQVMEKSKAQLGANHPDTLASVANLASTYIEQGRWTQAEELLLSVVEARTRILGAEHPSTLISMANLASAYTNQGRWNEAERLETQVTETNKALLGTDHPSTLTSMANQAATYMDQGRWAEAEKLSTVVMEARMSMLGTEHPSTLISMANLASAHRNQGQWDEAEKLEVMVMETSKTKLGAEHPSTLISIANLASTYRKQGRWDEAEKLEVMVMETSKTKLGAEHPSTLISIANLASTYRKQGRWEEAAELQAQVKEMSATPLGADTPDEEDETIQFMVQIDDKVSHRRNQGPGVRLRQAGGHLSEASLALVGRDVMSASSQLGTDDGPRSSFGTRHGRGLTLGSRFSTPSAVSRPGSGSASAVHEVR